MIEVEFTIKVTIPNAESAKDAYEELAAVMEANVYPWESQTFRELPREGEPGDERDTSELFDNG